MADAATGKDVALIGVSLPARWRWPALALLVLAYVVSGRLGLLLAIPPGYASAIFPPAGIAVAAVLCGGAVMLSGIFAGSLLLNLWVGFGVSGALDGRGVAAALAIALASSLQAAIGGAVLRRQLGLPTPMDHERPLLNFVLLAPLICLVSASASVAGLSLLGIVPLESVASSWFTWWIGDTLGVLVMLPLTLLLVGEPRALWRSRALTLGAPILVGVCLFVLIFMRLSQWEQKQSLLEFTRISHQAVDRIETGLDAQEVLLEQVERLFSGPHEVTRDEFRHFVGKALVRYPMIRALEWVPEVTASQRAAYEARERIEITEMSADLSRRFPAPAREVYYPVTFIEPTAGNQEVRGINMASRVGMRVLDAAAASGRATMTPPITLLQDRALRSAGPGGLIVYPVRSGANGRGVVAVVLRMHDYMEGLLQFADRQVFTRVDDLDAGKTLYDSFRDAAAAPLFMAELQFGGRHYRVQMTPTPAYFAGHRGWQSWSVLVAGLLFIGLLAAALLLSTGHAARTETKVVQRTAALQEQKIFSETVINSLPGVFYMLDGDGRLVHWNRNFMTVFGLTEQDLRNGDDVLQGTLSEDKALAREAIQRVYQSHGYEQIELRQHVADGQLRRYLTSGQYVEIGGKAYLLGTGVDITERREMEQEVQRNRKVLRTLIDAAPVWLAMVDRDGCMVIANRRLGETFGLPQSFIDGEHYSAVLPPETSIRMQSLLDASFAGREIEFSDEWSIAGLPTMYVHGKCVPVMDGDTAVNVIIAIMDLTEVHHVQSSLRTANAALERRVDEIRKLQVQLQEQAIRDPLTGLYNRRYLDETLEAELLKAQRAGYPVSIVMGDIDRFKRLNDTYGHQAGDQVIRMLADLLREHARASDILCRYGGEEFLLVMPQMSQQDAYARMELLRLAFADRRIAFGAFELAATISFGISAYPGDGKTADRLIAAADRALYEAKAGGRNRVELAKV